jgi:hypothetical protein
MPEGENTIVTLKKYLTTPERPVSMEEFKELLHRGGEDGVQADEARVTGSGGLAALDLRWIRQANAGCTMALVPSVRDARARFRRS